MIATLFNAPYFTGASTAAQVPSVYQVAIGGRAFLVDWESARYKRSSVPLLRQQADSSDRPGEHSLNAEEMWRRTMVSWHHGAGQANVDREDSDPFRFEWSKGIDPWTQWEVSLLHDTALVHGTASTSLSLATAGIYLYAVDTAVASTTDLTTWTTITGAPGSNPTGVCSDGFRVWVAYGSDGVFRTDRGTGTMTVYNTTPATVVAYVRGRLMTAYGTGIYNVTSSATPTALLQHDNDDFRWVGFTEGANGIYAAGWSGDKSELYFITIKDDATGLNAPRIAGRLPDGEVVRSIQGYLGFVLVGSDKGVRFASADSDGNLTLGALIPTTSPVLCFEGQDRFVWYGLTNLDSVSTGLGRLDLSQFTKPLTPAYASDLMAVAQGAVTSAVTFNGRRVFAVAGHGIYTETLNLVPMGQLVTGAVSYGMAEAKVASYLDLRHEPLQGSITASIVVDGGGGVFVGSSTVQGSTTSNGPLIVGQQRGGLFDIALTLNRATTSQYGPVLQRVTLRANPAPDRSSQWIVPLILADQIDNGVTQIPRVPEDDIAYITGLYADALEVAYQEGDELFSVFVDDYEWNPEAFSPSGRWKRGVLVVKLKGTSL